MPLKSRILLPAALFLSLSACDGPTGPTPPQPACTYTLSATTLSVPAAGGSAAVGVTTTSQCAWTAASDRDWMTITSGASGTGNGTVNVVVTVNPGPTVRTGTLTVAGQAVAVREEAQPACTVALTPPSVAVGPSPFSGTFAVASPSYCQWTAVSAAPWLTVTSGSAGSGNGTVAYAVDRNRETTVRAASIVVNDKSFVATQEGEVVVACEYSVTPVEFTPCMASTTMTAMVTTQATCSWTAAPVSSWITLTEGHIGTGSGLVSFRVSDNYDAPRQGIVEVRWPTVTAGQNLRVLQAGCYYGVSTSNINVATVGGQGHFDVVQQSDPQLCGGPLQNACLWTADSQVPWIIITTPMPQRGDNRVNFTVAPNNTGASRTGTIVVRDKTVTITQSGS
jgi:Viral BACON domain/Putative binding domain, N-terminal